MQYSLIHPIYELQRDEYLHLDQGQHLAWGYISVPPFTSWISYLIHLLGNNVFWVKFFPALFGVGTMILICKAVEELGGGFFAFVTAGLAVLLSVILRMNMLYQPNSFDIFFWTLTYFTVVKCISTGNTRWLIVTGVSIGFGLLSKYNIAFLVCGLFPAVILTRHRKLLLSRDFIIGIIIAVIIVAPNVLWQYHNNFPTIKQLQELSDTQLVNVSRLNFLKDQIIYFLGILIVIVLALIGLISYERFRPYRLFLYSYIFTLVLFILLKAKSYYAVGLYPILIAFGCTYLEKISEQKKYLRYLSIGYIIIFTVPFIYLAFPINPPEKIAANPGLYKTLGLLRWEDGKDHQLPQDFADMLGWKELAAKTDSAYSLFDNKDEVLVLCDNYGQAGAVNYYSSYKSINAVSFNADYINWIPVHKKIKHIILMQHADDDDPGRTRERPWFEKVFITGKITNPFAREYGTTIYVLQNARIDINEIINQEIAKRRY